MNSTQGVTPWFTGWKGAVLSWVSRAGAMSVPLFSLCVLPAHHSMGLIVTHHCSGIACECSASDAGPQCGSSNNGAEMASRMSILAFQGGWPRVLSISTHIVCVAIVVRLHSSHGFWFLGALVPGCECHILHAAWCSCGADVDWCHMARKCSGLHLPSSFCGWFWGFEVCMCVGANWQHAYAATISGYSLAFLVAATVSSEAWLVFVWIWREEDGRAFRIITK